jgi:hypothetical protein
MAAFYRVVSIAEYEDILATGVLRAVPNSAEGKYFWAQIGHARVFCQKVLTLGWESECIIIRVEVVDSAAERFRWFPDMDQIGLGCYAELVDLHEAVIRTVPE